jgi:hypothetical protein
MFTKCILDVILEESVINKWQTSMCNWCVHVAGGGQNCLFLRMEVVGYQLTKKIIGLVMAVIGGIGFVIARKVLSTINKATSNAIINSIKKDSSKAKVFADSLDIPYSKRADFTEDHFSRLTDYLRSVVAVGKYRILYAVAYEPDHILVFTEISFVDFDINVTGRPSDVSKKAYHNFVLRFDREKGMLIILSTVYSEATEKFQKEGFINAIFTGS